jgi:pilus assembly protein Flp/PilA
MKNLVSRFLKDESGATAIEYGLIAAGISIAIITVVQLVGGQLNTSKRSKPRWRSGVNVSEDAPGHGHLGPWRFRHLSVGAPAAGPSGSVVWDGSPVITRLWHTHQSPSRMGLVAP